MPFHTQTSTTVQTYDCRICHQRYPYSWLKASCEQEHEAQGVTRNVDLFKRLVGNDGWGARSGLPRLRKLLCIWRLYRYRDLTPRQIADVLDMNRNGLSRVKEWIGEIFTFLCRHDSTCVFRKYFQVK